MRSQHKIREPVLSEMHHSLSNEKYVSQIFRPVEKIFINKDSWLKDTVAFNKPKIFSTVFFTDGSMQILKSNQLYYIPFSADEETQDSRNINVDLKVNSNSILKRISRGNNVTG